MQGVPSATHSGWEVKDEQLVMALGGALALAKAPAKRQKIVLTVSALLVPGDAGGAAASGTHPTIATTVGVPKSQLCTAAAAAPLLPRPLCRKACQSSRGPSCYFTTTESRISGFY